ncbi:MAG: hypothetical protein ACP5IB_06630 [Thermoplasmata archaeon]
MFVLEFFFTVIYNLFYPIIPNPPSTFTYAPQVVYYFTPLLILGITIMSEAPGEQQYLAKEYTTIRYF